MIDLETKFNKEISTFYYKQDKCFEMQPDSNLYIAMDKSADTPGCKIYKGYDSWNDFCEKISYKEIWDNGLSLNFYELIRKDRECLAYFDIDNKDVGEKYNNDPNLVIETFSNLYQDFFKPLYSNKSKIYWKNASGENYLSLQCCIRNGKKFRNSIEAGIFAKELQDYFDEHNAEIKFDMSIYNSNKCIRLLYSQKLNVKEGRKIIPFTKVNNEQPDSLFLVTKLFNDDFFYDEPEIKIEKPKYEIEIENENETDVDYDYIIDLLELLDDDRCDNYDSWKNIVWILCNEIKDIGQRSLIIHDYSKKSEKYDKKATNLLIKQYKPQKDKKLTIGTIKFYAKDDSPDGYSEWCNKYCKKKNLCYDHIKTEFEKTHFKCVRNGLYYEITDSEIITRSLAEIKNAYMELACERFEKDKLINVSFIKYWLIDPEIRRYEIVDMIPPPLICPNNCFNLWIGFKAEKYIRIDDDNSIKDFNIILNLFKRLMNHDELFIEYNFKWLGMLFQKPGLKNTINILIRSLQGVGKNMSIDILELLMGEHLVFRTANPEVDIFGFNSQLVGKILVLLDEMNMKLSSKFADRLKDFLSNSKININGKSDKLYTINSYIHSMMFSNQDIPIPLPHDDRRNFPVNNTQSSLTLIEINEILNAMKNESALRMLYDFFMSVDISNFHPEKSRPNNEFFNDLVSLSIPIERRFICDFISNSNKKSFFITNEELMNELKLFMSDNNVSFEYLGDTQKLSQKIKMMNIHGFEANRKSINNKTKRGWTIDVAISKKSLIDKHWIDDIIPLLR